MRLSFRLIGSTAALLALTPVAHAADTPAVAVVRDFLADRAAGKYDAAYALLSAGSKQGITAAQFAAGDPSSAADKTMPAALFDAAALFFDAHNTSGCTFTIVGPDPANPHIVRVTAARPAMPVAALRLLTLTDPQTHALRLDIMGSFKQVAPKETAAIRRSAARAVSQSNLKQMALGIIQYEQDHDERMPDALQWVDDILPYVRSLAVFHDPAAPAGQAWGYACNRALSHKSLAQFDAPAQTVMLFESTKGIKNAADTGQSVPRPGRHEGGTDYAFADGHVKWFPDGTKLSFRLDGK